MKLVLAGITLLVATIAIGVGCGPKETYCYADMETCRAAAAAVKQDAEFEAQPDAEASAGPCFNPVTGEEIMCGG